MGKLVPCKTCQKEIDNTAPFCPHCGVKKPGSTAAGCFPVVLVVFLSSALLFFLGGQGNSNKAPAYKQPLPPQNTVMPILDALPAPFKNPEEYVGLSIIDASGRSGRSFQQNAADVHSINYEDENAALWIHAASGIVTWVDIDLKKAKPCYLKTPFDPNPILLALGINPDELAPGLLNATHAHTFYDHKRRLKISIVCNGDGDPLNVFIGSKFYLQ